MATLRIKNLDRFSSDLQASMDNLSSNVFDSLVKDAKKLFDGVARQVENSPEYKELRNSDKLRGQLGLAKPANKFGSDTDAEDLLQELKDFSLNVVSTKSIRRLTVQFKPLEELERILQHNLSSITDTGISIGPRVSWFRWWEFGDRGEITTLTITAANISKSIQRQKQKGQGTVSRQKLLDLITARSRSGSALQLPSLPADADSHIFGRSRIQQTYANYLKIFPARMGKTLKALIRKSNVFSRV